MPEWVQLLENIFSAFKPLSELVTWPIVVLSLGILFRRNLSDLMPRLIKIGPSGAEFGSQQVTGKSSRDALEAADASAESGYLESIPLTDPIATQIEENHYKTLMSIPENRRERALLRALTNTQMEKFFALAYANIYGSQIRALDFLNGNPIDRKQAEVMFAEMQEKEPFFSGKTLSEFMQYLLYWNFVSEHSERYEITETGRSFLRYLINAGLSKDRPF